ncbi:hypothetical protein RSAG8_09087, partial [Rhizoctonia solani AG-8 WAC10335]
MSFFGEFLRDRSYKPYHLGLRAFASLGLVGPVLLAIDAPHGRFSIDPSSSQTWIKRAWGALSVDGEVDISGDYHRFLPKLGTVSWMIMELPAPITLLYAFSQQTTLSSLSPFSLTPHSALPLLFVGHYLNRAIISPLRTPSRSKSHVIVLLAAVAFNLINGSVTGTWLGAGVQTGSIGWTDTPVAYWIGLAMFGLGLWGNIWHDEVLLDLRKNRDGKKDNKPRYAIPYGFALASGSIMTPLQRRLTLGSYSGVYFTPTLLFALVEVALMLPRARRGHQWYHERFSDYPKERKAVIPFLL